MHNTSTLNHSRGMFEGHTSHNFCDDDVFALKTFPFCIAASVPELHAAAIDALCVREERWHEEDRKAAEEKRAPQHPGPINNLADYTNRFLINLDAYCGMTETNFRRDRDRRKICMPPLAHLDEISEDGHSLVDLLPAAEPKEIEKWRTVILSDEFEGVLEELGDSVEGVAELIHELKGKTKRRLLQVLQQQIEKMSDAKFRQLKEGGQGTLELEKGVFGFDGEAA